MFCGYPKPQPLFATAWQKVLTPKTLTYSANISKKKIQKDHILKSKLKYMKPAETVMLSFFQIQNSLRFAHWRAKKYSTHKALDKFLDKFMDKMDEFIEIWQGKYGRIEYTKKNHEKDVKIYQIDADDLDKYLDVIIGFLSGVKDKNCKKYVIHNKTDYCGITILDIMDKNDTDLLNLRDEILGIVNRLKYLLSLS